MIVNRQTSKRGVILTALELEYSAVRAHLSNLREAIHKGSIYEIGTFIVGDTQWDICIAQTKAGNPNASFEAERVINYFDPEVVLFVGIAGGIKDVQIGDVVAADRVYGYESGKMLGQSFKVRPDVGESSYNLIQRAGAEARKQNWQHRIIQASRSKPRAIVGPIAAGEKVLASSKSALMTFLMNNYNGTLAIEMEGRGFLKATHANQTVQALIVRGISDLLDKKSSGDAQGFQDLAADHASAFAFEILAQLHPPTATFQKLETIEANETPAPKVPRTNDEASMLQLIDLYITEDKHRPFLDITLFNAGSQNIFPTRATLDILDVGKFHYEDEGNARSFVMISQNYDVQLAPEMVGQPQTVKISHQIRPGESERFQLTLSQSSQSSEQSAYVWYRIQLSIIYGAGQSLTSSPILLSVPPVTLDVWDPQQVWSASIVSDNLSTLRRLAALPAERSRSVENIIQRHQHSTIDKEERQNQSSNDRQLGTVQQARRNTLISDKREPIAIYFSYAREDEQHFQRLDDQLAIYRNSHKISEWHRGKIRAGEEIAVQVKRYLESARIIILLISSAYHNSDQQWQEMERAMERHNKGEAIVLPILLRPTTGWRISPYGGLPVLPRNEKAITIAADRDAAFAEVAAEIGTIIEDL